MAAAGAVIIADSADLGDTIGALLADPPRLEAMNRCAAAYADQQGGRLDEALRRLRPLLPPR
jgi:hypothetical protein